MSHVHFTHCLLAALVVVAAAGDIRRRKIPNWLTLGGVGAGLLAGTVNGGWSGLGQALGGMLLAFGVYFVLYCLRAMGAGDVKLMAAVGAIVGWSGWLEVFIASALAGGAFALALTIGTGRVRETWWNTAALVDELVHLRAPYRRRSQLDVRDRRALTMPHAVAIAAGTVACLLLARIG
jgi:prepilin peptidase CpaA